MYGLKRENNWTSEKTLYEMGLSKKLIHKGFKKCPSKEIEGVKYYRNEDVERIVNNPNFAEKIERNKEERKRENETKDNLKAIWNHIENTKNHLLTMSYKEIKDLAINEEATHRSILEDEIRKTYDDSRIEYVTLKYIRHHHADHYLSDAKYMSDYDRDGYAVYKNELCKAILTAFPQLEEAAKNWIQDDRKKSDKCYSLDKKRLETVKGHTPEAEVEEYSLDNPHILTYGKISVYNKDGQLIKTYKGMNEFLDKMFKSKKLPETQKCAEQRKLFNCLKNEIFYTNESNQEYICMLVRKPPIKLDILTVEHHGSNTSDNKILKSIVNQGRMDKIWMVQDDVIRVNNSKLEIPIYPIDNGMKNLSDFLNDKMISYYEQTGKKYEPANKTENMILEISEHHQSKIR